ncbi:hypothetical protein BDW66DRAFT_5540 [Aspergillus desertorum]
MFHSIQVAGTMILVLQIATYFAFLPWRWNFVPYPHYHLGSTCLPYTVAIPIFVKSLRSPMHSFRPSIYLFMLRLLISINRSVGVRLSWAVTVILSMTCFVHI